MFLLMLRVLLLAVSSDPRTCRKAGDVKAKKTEFSEMRVRAVALSQGGVLGLGREDWRRK